MKIRTILMKAQAILAIPYQFWGFICSDKKGDYNRAIAAYDQAIKLDPKYATAYNGRGIAYRNKGDYDRAIEDYDQAIKLNPKYTTAYNGRGYSLPQQRGL